MSDLISRSALIEAFQKSYCGHLEMEISDSMMSFKSICRKINNAPTVEAKPVQWIPCSERLPEEHDSSFASFKGTKFWRPGMSAGISDNVLVTVRYPDGKKRVLESRTTDGKWSCEKECFSDKKVIAWMPLPAPYNEERGGKNEENI